MKGPNILKLVLEATIYIALALIVNVIFPAKMFDSYLELNLGWVFLILFAFRRGPLPAVLAGGVFGALSYLFDINETSSIVAGLMVFVLANIMVGITGLFARNLQRTYHNKRLSSVYLNLITGTALATFARHAVLLLVDIIFNSKIVPDGQATFVYFLRQNGINMLINIALYVLILVIILNVQGKIFLPKDSPYLSRKERSRLLND